MTSLRASSKTLWFVILLGAIFRLIWPLDMEWKLDEKYMFDEAMGIARGEIWPWLGMPSGVGARNPGMSVWVFAAFSWLFGVTTPIGLSRVVQLLSVAAIVAIPTMLARQLPEKEREPWYWAAAFAAVNPFAVMLHRKIWAQSILPIFCVLFLYFWWKRDRKSGAFFWGLVGALLGQIHMSGFFYAAAFAGWALCFDRKHVRWLHWIGGSVIGALTLIPWVNYMLHRPPGGPGMLKGLGEAVQLKFWVFWLTDSWGATQAHAVGVLRGNGLLQQLEDFGRYPLWGESATYAVFAAYAFCVGLGVYLLGAAGYRVYKRRGSWREWFSPKKSETRFTQNAAWLGYGALLTVAMVYIRRYYLAITFPLEWVLIARSALDDGKSSSRERDHYRKILIALIAGQALVSALFLAYIHKNGGSPHGDYGRAYGRQSATEQKDRAAR